jgi:hypothetical protein
MTRLAAPHRSVGFVTLGLFLVSGMYMRTRFPEAYLGNESIRYLYRANHLYLLFAGLLNLLLGAYVVEASSGLRRQAQQAGSALLLFVPALLTWAFLTEPPRGVSHRPITFIAVVMAAAGTLLHVVAAGGGAEADEGSEPPSVSP